METNLYSYYYTNNSAIVTQINVDSNSLWITNNYSQIKYSSDVNLFPS